MTEDLKSQFSLRGLQEGFEHPLLEFKGRLEDYVPQPVDNFGAQRMVFQFTEVDVIETRPGIAYLFPVAQVSIKYSTKKNSSWGVLSASIPDEYDLPNLIGKLLHWKWRDGHKFGVDRETGKDMLGGVWECIGVEGGTAKTTVPSGKASAPAADPEAGIAKVLELIDGKTDQQFNQQAFADPVIKADGQLQASILNNTLIASLIAAGKLTKDENGVHHVVEELPF